MFGWIRRVFDAARDRVDDTVRHWVNDLVNGVYGFLHNIFGFVGESWSEIWHGIYAWANQLKNLAGAVVTVVGKLWHYWLPHFSTWIRDVAVKTDKLFTDVSRYVAREVARLVKSIDHAVSFVQRWVWSNIWRPIWKTLGSAWHWVTHEGNTIWHYITHPDKLVGLIWDNLISKLESEAWSIGKQLGTFTLALIVHNMSRIVVLIEDILNAVF